jgi:hypothetical protein
VPDAGGAACRTETVAAHRGRSGARRKRRHDHRTTDPLALPGLLVVAPVTSRFAFARARLAQDGWRPAYKLSSGRSWWRCLRVSSSWGKLHPCAERLAKHLSWQLGDRVTLTDIRSVLGGYAAYHGLSMRTAWTDWGRMVAAGWLTPTRAPANQGPSRPQGPGSGRAARYTLTAPAQVITKLRSRSCQLVTALDTFSLEEASPSPSVPPHRQDHQRGWITLCSPTLTQRQDASALLAGCQEPWRRQRSNRDLLTRPDWQRLLPLVAQVQSQRPDVPLTAVLTDRVASARSLPGVLAWRLWQLLRQPRRQETRSEEPPRQPAPHTPRMTVEETEEWQQHLAVVRALGGPAAARAALAASTTSAPPPSPTSRTPHTPPPPRRPTAPLPPDGPGAPNPICDLDNR